MIENWGKCFDKNGKDGVLLTVLLVLVVVVVVVVVMYLFQDGYKQNLQLHITNIHKYKFN